MAKAISLVEGVIRPSLVAELEAFRAPDRRASSYYLDLDARRRGDAGAVRRDLRTALARERERIGSLEVSHDARQALRRDLESVEEVASSVIGERSTTGLACFVASEDGDGKALRLAWPVRRRAFFEDRFVLWPLQQVLDQSDRYAVILTDQDDARLFLFFQERIEEVKDILDEVPGRVRFPDPYRELEYMRKQVEYTHHHFDRVAEAALRLFRRERFEHVIIGGLWETLPRFEGRLHRYVRDRIIARWDIDVQHTPAPQVQERTRKEEQQFVARQAQEIWKAIQDFRPQRGALGPDEVFAALWRRAVDSQLVDPDASRAGFRCTTCSRLSLDDRPCVECGGSKAEVPDIDEEAVHEAIEQSGHVRYWKDRALDEVASLAAFRRF